jgi:hypothetical protein
MRQTLLIAAIAAALGAATALLASRPPPPPRSERLGTRELSWALEAAVVRALEAVARERTPVPPRAVEVPEPPAEAARRPGALLPPPRTDVLQRLPHLSDDAELRRDWIFRTDREVLEWLGTPSRAFVEGGREVWVYSLAGNDGRERVAVTFHRGRLIDLRHEAG